MKALTGEQVETMTSRELIAQMGERHGEPFLRRLAADVHSLIERGELGPGALEYAAEAEAWLRRPPQPGD